jgi:hypothetical protein
MTSCRDSPNRIWLTTRLYSGAEVCSKKSCNGSTGSGTALIIKRNNLKKRSSGHQLAQRPLLNRRTFLGKRSPKGSKDDPDPAVNKHGHCLAKPKSAKGCKAVGHGYFHDKLAGPIDNPEPDCNFRNHCKDKESNGVIVERDWVNGQCVLPPADETACDSQLDYDWFLATGDSSAACHYKDRCKLEPEVCAHVFNKIQFDWFVKVGETDYGCHGALECNEKEHWQWNNVTWPELYIAHPYYDSAITGFSICQPMNEAICVSQATALTPWTWWTNDYQECRLDPTKREACLELPNLHWNNIVESFWTSSLCYVIRQETNLGLSRCE